MAFWDLFVSKNNKGLTSSLTADAKPSFRIKIPHKSHIIAFNPAYSCLVSPISQIPNSIAHFNLFILLILKAVTRIHERPPPICMQNACNPIIIQLHKRKWLQNFIAILVSKSRDPHLDLKTTFMLLLAINLIFQFRRDKFFQLINHMIKLFFAPLFQIIFTAGDREFSSRSLFHR